MEKIKGHCPDIYLAKPQAHAAVFALHAAEPQLFSAVHLFWQLLQDVIFSTLGLAFALTAKKVPAAAITKVPKTIANNILFICIHLIKIRKRNSL